MRKMIAFLGMLGSVAGLAIAFVLPQLIALFVILTGFPASFLLVLVFVAVLGFQTIGDGITLALLL